MAGKKNPEQSTRDKIIGGIAAVALLGGAVAGAWLGIQKLQEDSAYRRAHITTAVEMSQEMSKEVMSARSSFVLGVADGEMLSFDVGRHHGRYVTDSALNAEYKAAGAAWQKEARLSRHEIEELARHVLQENKALEALYESAKGEVEYATGKGFEAENLVAVAVLRGMIDATGGAIELDDRLDRRIDKLLAGAGPEAAGILAKVTADAAKSIATEAQANGKLLTHIQNRLNQMPAELASFSMRLGKGGLNRVSIGLSEEASPSRVDLQPVNGLPLDPFIDGMAHGDPFATAAAKHSNDPALN